MLLTLRGERDGVCPMGGCTSTVWAGAETASHTDHLLLALCTLWGGSHTARTSAQTLPFDTMLVRTETFFLL